MIFWCMVFIGVLFGWMGFKKGVFVFWTTLLNLMIAVYVAVMAAPVIIQISPEYKDTGYYEAACVFLTGGLLFAALQSFAIAVIFPDSENMFPAAVDKIGGAIAGFLTGYSMTAFLLLVFCIMPFSRQGYLDAVAKRDTILNLSSKSMVRICRIIESYSLEWLDVEPQAIIDRLSAAGQPKDNRSPTPANINPAEQL